MRLVFVSFGPFIRLLPSYCTATSTNVIDTGDTNPSRQTFSQRLFLCCWDMLSNVFRRLFFFGVERGYFIRWSAIHCISLSYNRMCKKLCNWRIVGPASVVLIPKLVYSAIDQQERKCMIWSTKIWRSLNATQSTVMCRFMCEYVVVCVYACVFVCMRARMCVCACSRACEFLFCVCVLNLPNPQSATERS